MFAKLVESAVLVADLSAKSKDAALKELLGSAQASSGLSPKAQKAMVKRLLDREAIGSTGLGNGVAVPHAKTDDTGGVTLALARSKAGIEWQAIDGRPVHIVFLLVSPASDPETHLRCLRWIATLARSSDFRRFLLDSSSVDAMRDLLREMVPKE